MSFGTGSQKDEELRLALLRYFEDVVTIRKEEMRLAKEVVMFFIKILKKDLAEADLKLEVGEPIYSGSVWEGLKTEAANEFDVVFPLILNGDAWDFNKVKLNEYSTNYGPYICYLKHGNHSVEDASILRKYGVHNLVEKTLDPMRVKEAFQIEVVRILKAHHGPNGNFGYKYADTSETSPAVTLDLYRTCTPDNLISLDLVPCLQIKKPNEEDVVLLVPKGDEGHYFRRSFSIQEKNLLRSIDGKDNGCRKKVLRILKTVFRSSKFKQKPELAKLDSFTIKNAVMFLHKSVNWSEENIAGCFKEVLRYLEDCFKEGELPGYFERKHNILRDKDALKMENTAGFLQNIRERNAYIRLLN